MEAGLVARAVAAASAVGRDLGLDVREVVVLRHSNTVALRLLPCDVFARAALDWHEIAAFEVVVAQSLAAVSAPTPSLDPRVEPRVYERDSFGITLWTYYEAGTDSPSPAEYASALHRLHAAMRSVEVEAPHFTERIAAAEGVLVNRHETPALLDADRALLLETLRSGRRAVCRSGHADQLLHGEPHPGNLLDTGDGPVFIDFETCCLGPIEFDLPHAPVEVSEHYSGVDRSLLEECRRLVLAMVAAWRWETRDQFPNGRRHGLNLLKLLRNGPPWPALGELSTG